MIACWRAYRLEPQGSPHFGSGIDEEKNLEGGAAFTKKLGGARSTFDLC